MPDFRYSLLLALSLPLAGLAPSVASAQVVTAGTDSVQVASRPVTADSTRRTERLLGMRVTRPQKAALLALALPGAGQVYNHRYWKLPLVYGGLGGVGYGLYHYQTLYREYVDGKNELIAGKKLGELSGKDVRQETSEANVQRGINFYRRNRDTFIAYTAVVYGITILDALVDAHLRNFDISDDLSLRLDPALLPTPGQAPRAGLALTLSVR
ncbi:DUF5683 domain-containing protein [Hymenobacter actinosclerus]|uniref:DUF5683 domain-containing protein n=1 Tax=Hymenobacter actinosclerus TaxID=82805 RepID=A0A1I0B4E2_9BACT|nr:DUF5683 domain-containing protein [Hymenobacter actinosclerus]SET00975.1 hypothetical protein SAMN04487998_0922 [Hymenobacter actinosclerus]